MNDKTYDYIMYMTRDMIHDTVTITHYKFNLRYTKFNDINWCVVDHLFSAINEAVE